MAEAKKSFFSNKFTLIALALLIGVVIGGYLMHVFIEPELNKDSVSEMNSLKSTNSLLDEQVSALSDCLKKVNIDPNSCGK
ncbi:MAG: hypothetical protein JW703_00385 [Candidatus Diapherotrites archaeon]|nr:hypothetical protein [Candidatus Diapherotrites archaeon]